MKDLTIELRPVARFTYDTLCSLLDRLQDEGGEISWEAYKTTRPETCREIYRF